MARRALHSVCIRAAQPEAGVKKMKEEGKDIRVGRTLAQERTRPRAVRRRLPAPTRAYRRARRAQRPSRDRSWSCAARTIPSRCPRSRGALCLRLTGHGPCRAHGTAPGLVTRRHRARRVDGRSLKVRRSLGRGRILQVVRTRTAIGANESIRPTSDHDETHAGTQKRGVVCIAHDRCEVVLT
jgi:hypothetical protein